MRTQAKIFDELIISDAKELKGKEFRLTIDGVVDDEDATIELSIRVLNKDQVVSASVLKATIRNPMTITGMVVAAAAVGYAWCVSANFLGSTGKLLYQAYGESTKVENKMTRGKRCLDVFKRFKTKHPEIKGEAIKILIGCLSRTVS